MRNYKAESVDAYIANTPEEARPHLKELRKIARSTIPTAEEKISWGVPFYWYHGALAGFSVFTQHISFGLAFVLEAADREALEKDGYATGKKTVQIRFDQKVPTAMLEKILRAQAKVNESKKK